MKLKRLVASTLALLLAVSLLPMTALAEGTFTTPGGTIEEGQDFTYNEATNVTNYGTVINNSWGSTTSPIPVSIKDNYGTVDNNGGSYEGTVENNKEGGTVENNNSNGTVQNNYGLVGMKDGNGNLITGGTSGNAGTVENNKEGGIVTNNTGTVKTNETGGTIVNNSGVVGEEAPLEDYPEGFTPSSGNYGTVTENKENGTVYNNQGGKVEINSGTVTNKGGTVGINNGMVYNNTPDSVVKVNEVGGRVANNSLGPDAAGAKVETNFGTVDYEVPGNDEYKTYYGVHYEVDGKKVYIDQFEESKPVTISELVIPRSGYKLVKCEKVEVYNNNDFEDFTDQTVSVDGKKTTVATRNEDGSVSGFFILAPTRLTLLWEKIASVFKPAPSNEPEAKPVNAAALPSTVKAEDVKVGTVVRVKGQLFRVVEMDDGSMTVVTMGKLSKKDMEDLMTFLSKYFTPEQIELLLGDPELISGELAEQLFGGNTGHIVFKAEKNLFA